MGEKVKVLVVDDQFIARGYFEMNVKSSTRYEVAGSLPSAESAVSFCDSHKVDLVVMDVMMKNGVDGITAAERIKDNHPEIKIILATSTSESTWEDKARRIGVESFWYKEYSEAPLLEIMDRTMDGEHVYPGDSPKPRFGQVTKADFGERELDVLRELTRSRTNEEIAEILGISVNTVKRHIQNMLEKTGYRHRLELAVNAVALGLVVSEDERLGNL